MKSGGPIHSMRQLLRRLRCCQEGRSPARAASERSGITLGSSFLHSFHSLSPFFENRELLFVRHTPTSASRARIIALGSLLGVPACRARQQADKVSIPDGVHGSEQATCNRTEFPHLTYLCDRQRVNHMIESAALLLGACYVSALRHFQSTKRWSPSLDGIGERYGRCQGACEKACGILRPVSMSSPT